MLCPLKFNNPKIQPERINDLCQCEQSQCAWWVDCYSSQGNVPRCSITILKNIAIQLENLADNQVKIHD